ncbi:MAG: hypothetical protein WCC94_10330 [Candidatus Bathyarchaeia archaeon]
MSYALFWPLLFGGLIALLIILKATETVKWRAFVLFLLYCFAMVFFYYPQWLSLQTWSSTFGMAFTETVEEFAGIEWHGQVWLASMIGSFTLRFTRTQLETATWIPAVLDAISVFGFIATFIFHLSQYL